MGLGNDDIEIINLVLVLYATALSAAFCGLAVIVGLSPFGLFCAIYSSLIFFVGNSNERGSLL